MTGSPESGLPSWIRRHRRLVLAAIGVVGGLVLAGSLREFTHSLNDAETAFASLSSPPFLVLQSVVTSVVFFAAHGVVQRWRGPWRSAVAVTAACLACAVFVGYYFVASLRVHDVPAPFSADGSLSEEQRQRQIAAAIAEHADLSEVPYGAGQALISDVVGPAGAYGAPMVYRVFWPFGARAVVGPFVAEHPEEDLRDALAENDYELVVQFLIAPDGPAALRTPRFEGAVVMTRAVFFAWHTAAILLACVAFAATVSRYGSAWLDAAGEVFGGDERDARGEPQVATRGARPASAPAPAGAEAGAALGAGERSGRSEA